MTLPALIDKQDNFEIIRDQIAVILATEIANQRVLANEADKDPSDWKLRIFTERANPWEQWRDQQADTSPIVNVWFDGDTFDMASSNIVERQKATATYNIDCHGYGKSTDDPACGHIPGDRAAAFEAQRAVRLVRNILMAAENTYLGMRGVVWRRWTRGITMFQPQFGNVDALQVLGARLAFQVEFNELSPQVVPVDLELVSIDALRTEDGEILVEADYEYPL